MGLGLLTAWPLRPKSNISKGRKRTGPGRLKFLPIIGTVSLPSCCTGPSKSHPPPARGGGERIRREQGRRSHGMPDTLALSSGKYDPPPSQVPTTAPFFLLLFFFLGPHPRHMEVPRLESNQSYATATATWDLNPLSKARDGTRNLMILAGFINH